MAAPAGDQPLVVDNGGCTLRMGWAGEASPRVTVPNATARIKRQLRLLVADETEDRIKDHSQLVYMRPVERGYLTDCFMQETIWERCLAFPSLSGGQGGAGRATADVTAGRPLVMLSPPFAPITVQRVMAELVFEKHGFASMACPTPAAALAERWRRVGVPSTSGSGDDTSHDAFIIIDAGFSGTHIYPCYQNRVVTEGIRRVEVGGKLLTNYLKELVSYRQWNMMDDSWTVNRVKERLCYVSPAFHAELALARHLSTPSAMKAMAKAAASGVPLSLSGGGVPPYMAGMGVGPRREYVLPDFTAIQHGYVRGGADDPTLPAASARIRSATSPAEGPHVVVEAGEHATGTPKRGRQVDGGDTSAAKRPRPTRLPRVPHDGGGAGDKGEGGDDDDSVVDDTASMSDSEPSPARGGSADGDALPAGARGHDGDYVPSDARNVVGEGGVRQLASRAAAAGVDRLVAAESGEAGLASGGGVDDSQAQVLTMNSERFVVPEVLFHPGDIGLDQAGIHEAVAQAIAACPSHMHPGLWSTIRLTGGSALLPNLATRLQRELLHHRPTHLPIHVAALSHPLEAAWQAASLVCGEGHPFHLVTRRQYEEEGERALARLFI